MRAARTVAWCLAGACAVGGPAFASEQIYRPISPGFGGSPFNTDYVFGTAEKAQSNPNGKSDRNSFSSRQSTLDAFTQSLQARLLGQISDDIVTAIFGENAREEGRFEVAGTVVEFQRRGDQIHLTITDTVHGQSTEIDVPVPRL